MGIHCFGNFCEGLKLIKNLKNSWPLVLHIDAQCTESCSEGHVCGPCLRLRGTGGGVGERQLSLCNFKCHLRICVILFAYYLLEKYINKK